MMSNAPASAYSWPSHELLPADLDRALFRRILDKPVSSFRVLDDMETDGGWTATDAVTLGYTTDHCRSGSRSLRLTFAQRNEDYIRSARAANGSFTGEAVLFDVLPFAAAARLRFGAPQDWSASTRLGLWCYVHPTGSPVNALALQFTSAGADAGPVDPIAITYFADMVPGEWNHLVWEFPEIARDAVVDLSIFLPTAGLNFADQTSLTSFDIDDLRLEDVVAERVSGWEVDSDSISYSHVGYRVAGSKIALGHESVSQFDVVDEDSGQVVATLPATPSRTRTGAHAVLDFSDIAVAGTYRIVTDGARTEPFAIADDSSDELIEATLNAIYAMRCGFAIPGVHDACHIDHVVSYGGETRVQGGGWHDAANLSQDPGNTHVTVCALLDLADALDARHAVLAARAREEARWGLEWVLRMRFGPGIRYLYGRQSYYTDGVVGTIDDIVDENVGSDAFINITAALAEVRGARALRASDPELSGALLRAAREDFDAVRRERSEAPVEDGLPDWRVASWQNELGCMALVAAELWQASEDPADADEAARLGRLLADLQERRFIDGAPVTGYFYEDAARTRIVHEQQRTSGAPHSFEDAALLAFARLCQTLPDHPDWMIWYTGLVAYSEFYCAKGAEASAPFGLIPAAVWRQSDVDGPLIPDEDAAALSRHANPLFPSARTPELIRAQQRELYEAGAYLSPGQRLRTFPIYSDHVRHGSTAVHLTKAIGLGAAARVRGRSELAELLVRQVHWVVGANPFSRSLVYGVGHDWWQNFTVSLPNVVGGLSVGMNNYRGDEPAWGGNAVFPYKELWIVSLARMAAVLALAEPAEPEGDDRSGRGVALAVKEVDRAGRRMAEITVEGAGVHTIELRSSHLGALAAPGPIDLGGGGVYTIDVPLDVRDSETFWTLAIVPDGRIDRVVDLVGCTVPARDLSRPDAVTRDA